MFEQTPTCGRGARLAQTQHTVGKCKRDSLRLSSGFNSHGKRATAEKQFMYLVFLQDDGLIAPVKPSSVDDMLESSSIPSTRALPCRPALTIPSNAPCTAVWLHAIVPAVNICLWAAAYQVQVRMYMGWFPEGEPTFDLFFTLPCHADRLERASAPSTA